AKIFDLEPISALKYAKNLPQLPDGAEGWFAIPLVYALAAKHFSEVTNPAKKYCRAIRFMHTKIASSRSFYTCYKKGQITPAQLRISARTSHAQGLIAEKQAGDIMIIAAQLGLRHRGRSVRRAREVFMENEFGLGSFAVGSIFLTHPEREVQWKQLHVDCAGDEFSSEADNDFSDTPYFDFCDGKVKFNAYWCGFAYGSYGSASGFLTQPACR
ncbi:MAG: hypothetical protein PHZ25_03515, partial [Candidatus Pacebacteria bacterium]|nr:hypothetical protein [Candidatus Paceibacterota bacterium]